MAPSSFYVHLRVTLLLGGLLFNGASWAQDTGLPGHTVTLGVAVSRAQAMAPGVRGAEASASAADSAVRAAGLLPNPTVSVEVDNFGGTGPYSRFRGAETTYSVSVPLELGGKRAARVRVSNAELAQALTGVNAARSDLTLRVTRAFIAVAASERRLQSAVGRRQLAEQAEAAARLRTRAGKVSPIDEQRAMVQRVTAVVEAERAERAAKLAAANLARLIGADHSMRVQAAWFDDPTLEIASEGGGVGWTLASADAQVAAATAKVDAARRARMPDLTLTAGTRRFKETGDSAAIFALSMPLPLFNRGDAEIARARAELDKAQAERSEIVLALAEAQAAARAEVLDAQARAISATGPELAAAREAARIARLGYAEGKFSQLDLIEAERSLAQTQETAIDALANFHEARARLANLFGRIDPINKDN